MAGEASWLVGMYLKKGLDGSSVRGKVKVWSQPWLSTDLPLCPIGPPTLSSKDLCVSDLIDNNTRQWNLVQIREHLPAYEDTIWLIPLGTARRIDKQVWLPLKRGVYTTRSGYGVSVEQDIPTSYLQFNWQKHVWRVPTMPKIKSFLWKALVGALPVGILLQQHGIGI